MACVSSVRLLNKHFTTFCITSVSEWSPTVALLECSADQLQQLKNVTRRSYILHTGKNVNVCILNAANIQVFRSKRSNGNAEINLGN